jgi:N-acyl-D-amino-acid deacylase
MDILVNNVQVLDPTKKRVFPGGVAIIDQRIIEVYSETSAVPFDHFDRVIDGKGFFAIPGFFDIHSRGDLAMVFDPSRVSALSQGITSEVIGNDGFAVAPVRHSNYLLHGQYVASSLGNPQLKWHWESTSQYLDVLNTKNGTNVLFYAPHGTLRLEASLNTSLSHTGLDALLHLLERALDEGALGMSISCSQSPSKDGWSNDREMSMLAPLLKKKNAILSVCLEGSTTPLKDVERAVHFAKAGGIKLHLSRLFSESDENAEEIITLLEKGKKDLPGLIVDISPYHSRLLKLSNILPFWVKEISSEELRQQLKKPEAVQRMFESLNVKEEYLEKIKLVLTSKKDLKKHEGSLLEHIAMERDESIYDVLLNLVLFDSDKTFFEYEAVKPDVLKRIFELPFVLPATTGYLDGRAMPDMFGAIPTYIKHLSDLDALKIATRLSIIPAEFFGVKWGIKKGLKANMLILDPKRIYSEADYNNPRSLAEGLETVIVNGKIAFEKSKSTGLRCGEVLNWE